MSGSCERVAELLHEIAEVLGEISATLRDLVAIECERLLGPVVSEAQLKRYPACREYAAGPARA